MSKLHLLVVPAVLALVCLTAPKVWAEESAGLEKYPIGDLEVFAIRDADITMESKLLPQLDKYPQLQTYFNNGPLPAVDKVYYLQYGDHKILIDSGWGTDQNVEGRTREILNSQGIDPKDITDILLTHLDCDHIGGLAKGQQPVFPNAVLHVSQPEWEAWQKGAVQKRPAEKIKMAQDLAQIYQGRIKTFNFGDDVLPGIRGEDASGHTPGHTAYTIISGDGKLTVVGDVIHIAKIQLQKPELSTVYDMDMEAAAKTRQRLLEQAAGDRRQFAGMHFPMVSPVMALSDGGFAMREPR